jgi:hypothetical protein
MRAFLCILALTAIVTSSAAAPASGRMLLAQGGSTGGTIGKSGKSMSGGDDAPAPRATPAAKSSTTAKRAADGASDKRGCGNFFGIWTSGGGSWLYGQNDTTFNANGTARHRSGIVGTWTCSNREIVLIWKDWDNDRLKLSADGKRLDSLAGGKGFSR